MTIGQSPLPLIAPRFRAEASPARASDDLPLPEAKDRQEAVLLPCHPGAELVDEPFGERLAAEEEGGVLDVENLQPAVRAHALADRAVRSAARFLALDPAEQPVKRLRIVERAGELDPRRRCQESRQLRPLGTVHAGQEDGITRYRPRPS